MLNSYKYCYVSQTIQSNNSNFFAVICLQFNDQTVLVQTTQFIISHLFGHSLNAKQFYSTHR